MARDISGLVTGMALLEPGFTIAAEAPRTVGRLAIDADPKIGAAIDNALRAAGFDVRPVRVRDIEGVVAASLTVLSAAAWATNADLVRTSGDLIGADVLDRLRRASATTEADLAAARVTVAGWRAALDDLWLQVDVLAAPTLLGFPPLLEDAATMMALRGLTSPVNLAGVPSLAMPVPADGPLPASIQLIGPAGSEDRLLAFGAVLEAALRRLSGDAVWAPRARRARLA
jgi:amidase